MLLLRTAVHMGACNTIRVNFSMLAGAGALFRRAGTLFCRAPKRRASKSCPLTNTNNGVVLSFLEKTKRTNRFLFFLLKTNEPFPACRAKRQTGNGFFSSACVFTPQKRADDPDVM